MLYPFDMSKLNNSAVMEFVRCKLLWNHEVTDILHAAWLYQYHLSVTHLWRCAEFNLLFRHVIRTFFRAVSRPVKRWRLPAVTRRSSSRSAVVFFPPPRSDFCRIASSDCRISPSNFIARRFILSTASCLVREDGRERDREEKRRAVRR